jgi:acetyl-CoA carboxylase biotin carboxyl carrier protein
MRVAKKLPCARRQKQRKGRGAMADVKVLSELNATVWKIEVAPGALVAVGDTLILLESMKMEIPVLAPRPGRVKAILVAAEEPVREGQPLAVLEA